MTEYNVKNLIKECVNDDSIKYYVGRLKTKEKHSIGIYLDGYKDERLGIKSNTIYIRVLVHWNESPGQTLLNTIEIKKKLDKLSNQIWNDRNYSIDGYEVTRLKVGTPIDVDSDENDIYERVLHLEIDFNNKEM